MPSIKQLLKEYTPTVHAATKMQFAGMEGVDVYNVSAPARIDGIWHIFGRVEMREFEVGTVTMLFYLDGDVWKKRDFPAMSLQDPFLQRLGDAFMFGGVEVRRTSMSADLSYRMVFYYGDTLGDMKRVGHGPWGMKGIRFVQMGEKIGVFTRPQGRIGRRGKIAWTMIDSVGQIRPRTIQRAEIIPGMFARGEWGGVNDVHVIGKKLGVIGHVAQFDEERKRHYYPISFLFDPSTRQWSDMKIICNRGALPSGGVKRDDLYDVIYPGGIVREGGRARMFAGVSDAEAYEITIDDPFR